MLASGTGLGPCCCCGRKTKRSHPGGIKHVFNDKLGHYTSAFINLAQLNIMAELFNCIKLYLFLKRCSAHLVF